MQIMHNGHLISAEHAVVPLFSNTVQYGHGVSTTLRSYPPGGLFRAGQHVQRLLENAKAVGLDVAPAAETLLQWLDMLLAAEAEAHPGPLRVKLMVIAEGVVGMAAPLVIKPEIYQGVRLLSVPQIRAFPEVKPLAYLDSFLPHQQAVAAGYYDALLVNILGQATEGAYSNIFWFEGNTLCTPGNQVLPGITRQAVLELAPFPLDFVMRTPQQLAQADEVFLTQTTAGVVPVVGLDDQPIGNGTPGPHTQKLMGLFHALVAKETQA